VDVYGNIGRFYAARGIGVAVINYRLQPTVGWRDQVADVARALAWVHASISDYGGDQRHIFIGGHSAGAQLAARVALDSALLESLGLSTSSVCGVICVSGAGLDLGDDRTYELGACRSYYRQRFDTPLKTSQASPVVFAHRGGPPFLILYAGGETKALQRQSKNFAARLAEQSVQVEMIVVPGQSHARMVLALSRPDKTAGPAVLRFIGSGAHDFAFADRNTTDGFTVEDADYPEVCSHPRTQKDTMLNCQAGKKNAGKP
jgi:acetyl esterase/lipase